MVVAFCNLNSDSGLKKLDEYLLTRSYITGCVIVLQILFDDRLCLFICLKHLFCLFHAQVVYAHRCSSENPTTVVEDDDDVDLFSEETEEEKIVAEERAAALKASGKNKESGKSSVLLDVKPWDDETDMKKLEELFRWKDCFGEHEIITAWRRLR
nr:elongation factor 1-delta 2-like [Nicotiana tomentosiformis]